MVFMPWIGHVGETAVQVVESCVIVPTDFSGKQDLK